MVRLPGLRLLRRDDRGSVLPGRQPDGLAADHLRHLRAFLPGAAARGDLRRQLYRSRRPQGGAHPFDWADADRYDADGGHAGLRDDRARRADHHHRRAPVARLLGRRRVRQCGHLLGRAWWRAPRLQRELAMGYDWHDLDHRLAVWPRADLAALASAAGRLGLARALRVWAVGWAGRALHPLAHRRNPRVSECRKTAAHDDQRVAAPTAG